MIDGGHLLHLLPWPHHSSYKTLVDLYSSYVLKHYGAATIVFDGYSTKSSIKDMTHARRSSGKIGPTIDFKIDMTLTVPKKIFLSNERNKQQFINTLAHHLRQKGCPTIQAPEDADLYIVLEAMKQAEKNSTVIIGADTDLLALSIYYFDETAHKNVYISGHWSSQSSKKHNIKYWDVKRLKSAMGPVSSRILFCHALLGCDTT